MTEILWKQVAKKFVNINLFLTIFCRNAFSIPYLLQVCIFWGLSRCTVVKKNPPTKAAHAGDTGLIPGSGRSPGAGNGNLLSYSCLENSMARGAWQVAKSRTWLSTYAHTFSEKCFLSVCVYIYMFHSQYHHWL